MSPGKTPLKGVTPGSVKVLMLVEAGIIGFLTFWIMSEYSYNAYFRTYLDQILLSHLSTYTAALGLGIGLAGSVVAATLYRSLRRAKYRLETIVTPKIRGAVDKILSSLPTLDEPQSATATKRPPVSQSPAVAVASQTTTIVPIPEPVEQKKSSA